MDQELFNPQSSSVTSSRILYTPSTFARTSLLHLQEVGSLQAIHQHTSTRTNLTSFLCFVVLSGTGSLTYEGMTYELSVGDCVFIDCRKAYSHSTSDNLWSLQWCHFYAPSLPAVYEKYKERGGRPVFHPADIKPFTTLLTDIYDLASSSDYIRDMRINEKLGTLLTLLMEQSWHPESMTVSRKRLELAVVKEYLDEHFTEKIVLEELAENQEFQCCARVFHGHGTVLVWPRASGLSKTSADCDKPKAHAGGCSTLRICRKESVRSEFCIGYQSGRWCD